MIVDHKTVRLSSLTLSNDSAEGKMVYAAMARHAEGDGLASRSTERLLSMIDDLDEVLGGLGFCLSEERDQLGQWRGYADDGAGVAIGFSRSYLEELKKYYSPPKVKTFRLEKVEYDPDEHDRHVESTYRELRKLIDEGAFGTTGVRGLLDSRTAEEIEQDRERTASLLRKAILATLPLYAKLYVLKSPAFREESEWRLVSYHAVKQGGDEIEFRPAGGRIIPFISIELIDLDMPVIHEVILGPKHDTPVKIIEDLLDRAGFPDVRVERSASSYR